ncbi:MAG: DUF5906 domain-containing protein [Oscillospiraceae bacterium]|jgi:putative DNA primase/helicase|nr:DUF5906 domain-containing protein [Oscillospiraceae bacterium]
MITNLALFEGGEAVIHKLSRPYPKYDFMQTQAKIDHFHKSGTKPMTCKKIADSGFVCPKMKSGSCTCNAPAGLAFKAYTVPELKKLLLAQKKTGEATQDLIVAKQFVEAYLFNVEPDVAEVFIANDVKGHFGFKASDIKALPAFHKELYRQFASQREVKSDKFREELPPWYEFTDRGALRFMPSVLADHCAENEPIIYVGDSYYFYDGGVYLPRNDMAAERHIRGHMARDKYKTSGQIVDAEHQWRIQIDRPVTEINPNPYLLNCRNGLFNVLTEEFLPHKSSILSTIQVRGKYDPTAQCPVFLQYLSGVLPETEHALVQEMLGYFLIPVNKAQKSFLLVGKKDSGKSTLLEVVQNVLLGEGNFSTLSWQALDDRFSTFQLFGKLANVFADLPSKNLQDTGIFKAITGEDYIMGERKHKDGFSFKPFARLLFSCNKIPKNYSDRSSAFYGRLILMRFDHTIPANQQDKSLKEKLAQEADGILAWALVGLKRLMQNNYAFSETDRTRSELQKYMTENSNVLTFLEEQCVFDPGFESFREDIYNAYTEFCAANGGQPMSQIRFNSELEEHNDAVKRCQIMNRKAWRGVRLA